MYLGPGNAHKIVLKTIRPPAVKRKPKLQPTYHTPEERESLERFPGSTGPTARVPSEITKGRAQNVYFEPYPPHKIVARGITLSQNKPKVVMEQTPTPIPTPAQNNGVLATLAANKGKVLGAAILLGVAGTIIYKRSKNPEVLMRKAEKAADKARKLHEKAQAAILASLPATPATTAAAA